jgi:hypothetical protein
MGFGGRVAPREVDTPQAFTRAKVQAKGNRRDPYLFMRSKGRNGAAFRAKVMAAKMPKPPTGMSMPFVSQARNEAFLKAAAAGEPRNRAMKIARRVPA